jgi:hypothetical protein
LKVIDITRNAFAVLAVIGSMDQMSFSQSQAPAMNSSAGGSGSGLLSAANAEEEMGTNLFYTQNYRSGRRLVLFKGTLYAGITAFTAKKCELTIGTTIVDRYSGEIGRSKINDTQNIYNYSIEFALTPDIADSLRLIEARPSQLENGTHAECAEQRACAMNWLEIRAKRRVIKLTSITNDVEHYDGFVKDYDGMVDRFWIPVSSRDAGNDLISRLRSFAATCAQ